MIYLLYGEDGLSLEEALASLKAHTGPEKLQDINIATHDGRVVGVGECSRA